MNAPKRKTLAGLNSGPAETPEMPTPPQPKAVPPERPESRPVQIAQSLSAELRESGSSEARSPEVGTSGVPKYLRLERKDVLLWPRQLHELTVLRRVLNRKRGKGVGERLTENTLVRVAIDYLIAHAGELQGTTEDELRRSLGL